MSSTESHTEDIPLEVLHPGAVHEGETHWSDMQYVQLALGLAVITGLEVMLTYIRDDLGGFFLPTLLILMAIKFFAVVLYFMHLKFDNRLFSMLFYTGLFLAIGVYCTALLTFKFFQP